MSTTPVTYQGIPSSRTVEFTPKNLSTMAGLVSLPNNGLKIAAIGLGLGSFYAKAAGDKASATSCTKGKAIVDTMRVGLRVLNPVTDVVDLIDACQNQKYWDAALNGTSVVSDSLTTFNDIRGMAHQKFSPHIEVNIKHAETGITLIALTPLTITEAVKAVFLAGESHQLAQNAEDLANEGKMVQAIRVKSLAEQKETSAVTKLISVIEKTLVISVVIFAAIAAAFSLALTIVVPVIATLSLLSGVLAITRLCRNQFIKFAPQPSEADAKIQDALNRSGVARAVVEAAGRGDDAAGQLEAGDVANTKAQRDAAERNAAE